jgi:hypothetical protein
MVLKSVFIAVICVLLLAWSGLSIADGYRPGEFLGLDLSNAVLSPKPLGPPSQFAPGPLDVSADRGDEETQAKAEPQPEPKEAEPKTVVHTVRVEPAQTEKENTTRVAHVRREVSTPVAHARAEKPRGAGRVKLARRHGNPLDAQALDTRIQVWPCNTGGICNWKR